MTLLPFGLVLVLFSVLGFRLLRSAHQTRGAEIWLAGFFVFAAGSVFFRLPSVEPSLASGSWTQPANALGHVLTSLAICSFILFVWRVFRGGDAWASGLAAAMITVQVAAIFALLTTGGYRDERSETLLFCNAARAIPFAWGFAESIRYHILMKRRLRMNLADSVVANRFGLFSIWTGALFVLPLGILGVRLAVAHHVSGAANPSLEPVSWAMPIVRGTVLLCGGVSFAALWLSFFPPKSYLARLQHSALA